MARGGKRTGKIGKAYGNRKDLNPGTQAPKAPTGQGYGEAGAQLAAQKSVPLPHMQHVGVERGPDGRISGVNVVPPAPAPAMTPPGSGTPLTAPTEKPGQPLTNGIPGGAGAGPEALGIDDGSALVQAQMRALFRQFPLSEIADLIAEAHSGK